MKAVFSGMNGEPRRSAWMPLALALLVLVCFSSAPALGQSVWTGANSSNWFNGGNWSAAGVPTAGGNALINSTFNNPVLINAPSYSGIVASVNNLTLGNAANGLIVPSGDALYVYGSSISNAGAISLTGGGYGGSYLVLNNTALSGGGTVTLAGNGSNYIQQNGGGSYTLTNVDNTIQGYGQIGSNGLSLNNQAAGTINANVSGTTLYLNGGGAITNTGLLEATNGGTLSIYNNVANTGGNITANGATSSVAVYNNTVIAGGTLNSLNGGTLGIGNIFYTGGNVTLDGLTAGPITLYADAPTGTTWNSTSGNATNMQGTIVNNGNIQLSGGGYGGANLGFNTNTTLQGGGALTLGGNGFNYLYENVGNVTLTNANQVIQGYGFIGYNGLSLINQATIDANVSGGTLQLNDLGALTNSSLLEATNGGTLAIMDSVANAGANITANGATSSVLVSNGATIIGGTLSSLSGGTLGVGWPFGGASATLDGLTAGAINLHTDGLGGNTWTIFSGGTTYMQGTINNNGNIQLSGGGYGGANLVFNTNTTLQGGGTVTMGGNGYNYLSQGVSGVTLTNVDHTIQGYGQIGVNGLSVINQATIDANVSGGTLSLNGGGAFTNSSLLEATNGGTLAIYNDIANAGANITANGATSSVLVYNNAVIAGGTLNSLNGGTLGVGSGSPTLDGLTAGSLTLYTDGSGGNTWNISSGQATSMQGTIINNGNIQLSGGGYGPSNLGFNANTTLQGGGTVTMAGNGYNYLSQPVGGSYTLTNVDHTIQGSGYIGGNGLSVVNGTAGTILANGGGTLHIDGGGSLTNNGTLQANAGSTLQMSANYILTNFSGSTLAGGTYFANNGTLGLNLGSNEGGEIATNAATIHIFGADANFFDAYSNNALSNLSNNTSTGSFTVDGGAAFDADADGFTNAGAVLVGSGSSFSTSGDYIQTGGTTQDEGTLTASLLSILGGTLSGTGTVDGNVTIGAGGTLSPGDAPGEITIMGNYTQSGTLLDEIGGTPGSGQFGSTDISGTAAIGGALDIDLVSGFAPGVNTHYVYDILTANGGVSGVFGAVDFINLPSGDTFSLDYSNPNEVVLNLNGKPSGPGTVPEPSFFLPLAGLLAAVVGSKIRGRRRNAAA